MQFFTGNYFLYVSAKTVELVADKVIYIEDEAPVPTAIGASFTVDEARQLGQALIKAADALEAKKVNLSPAMKTLELARGNAKPTRKIK